MTQQARLLTRGSICPEPSVRCRCCWSAICLFISTRLGSPIPPRFGNRVGLVTLFMLISLVGGRIIPSFTHNWLAKARRDVSPPVAEGRFDMAALVVTGFALITWVIAPDAAVTPWAMLVDRAKRLPQYSSSILPVA